MIIASNVVLSYILGCQLFFHLFAFVLTVYAKVNFVFEQRECDIVMIDLMYVNAGMCWHWLMCLAKGGGGGEGVDLFGRGEEGRDHR